MDLNPFTPAERKMILAVTSIAGGPEDVTLKGFLFLLSSYRTPEADALRKRVTEELDKSNARAVPQR